MERQPNGWKWTPSRRGANKWSKTKVSRMHTAKHISNERRRRVCLEQREMYRGDPPPGEKLLEARLMIPGEYLVPVGLDRPLDRIRIEHQVWIITQVDSHIFDLRSRSMRNLQKALKALNWTIHDLRLSSERLPTLFLIQMPSKAGGANARICLELSSRPVVKNLDKGISNNPDNALVVDDLLQKIMRDLPTTAETLMALGKDLRMRVNFGRLNVLKKRKGIGNEFTYPEFENIMKPYASRGGAGLASRLPDTDRTEDVLRCLKDYRVISLDSDEISTHCTLTLTVQNGADFCEVSADIVEGQALPSGMRRPETWPRMDWTVIAPDRQFDWNIRVTAWDTLTDVPPDLQDLVHKIEIHRNAKQSSRGYLELPHIGLMKLGHLQDKISETRLTRSACISFRNEPYVVEVNVTQVWKGFNLKTLPETTWGLEVYGIHWDEAVNNVGVDGRKKDWGRDLINVWPGYEQTLKERIRKFLHCILQVEDALDGLDWEEPDSEASSDLLVFV